MRVQAWTIVGVLISSPAWSAVLYVDQSNVSGTEDGLTWQTAFATVQPAVDLAEPGDEVWIAAGSYGELRNAVDGALTLREGVSLYGGFAGNEGTLDERDPLAHVTIIDGSVSLLNGTAHHVIVAAQGTLLDGLTIRGGKATAGGFTGNYGGAVLIVGVDVTIRQCLFEANQGTLGGVIGHVNGGTLVISDSEFRNNSATSFGGAIYDEGGSSYSRCTFRANNALMGGAVALSVGTLSMEECVFEDNRALLRDGGAFWINFEGIAELDVIRFTGNIAETDGGAVANWSGTVAMRNALFFNNRATRAGGAVFTLAPISLTHCTVWGNSAKEDSAAVVSNGGSITAVNSDFGQNTPASILNLSVLPADVTFSNIEGGYPGEGNLDVDSKYRDSEAGDFRLLPASPLIDAGTEVEGVTVDFRGFPRPAGLGFDIGIAEFYDSDGDLMEDDWEEEFGLDPSDPSDGAADADADGLSNAREFELNTDPANPADPAREFYVEKTGDDANPGTSESPFLTIGRAISAARSFGNALAVHVGAGVFEEQVEVPDGVLLRGAGASETEIRHFDLLDERHVVVELGEGSRVEQCRISLPPLQSGFGALASVQGVSGVIEGVTLDGGDSLFSIGVSVQGADSSNALISNCRIRRVQVGIQTADSVVNIRGNTFEGIRGDAILVNLPDTKQGAAPRVPILGREGVAGTGGNVFGSVVGYFVVNLTTTAVPAEDNDWGLVDRAAIAEKMFGPVDFRPYAGEKERQFLGCGPAAPRSTCAGDLLAMIAALALLLVPRARGGISGRV